MHQEKTCLICGSANLVWTPATLAPFIRARCAIQDPLADLARAYCGACDFSFYTYRYGDEEIARLYRNYRDLAYHQLRIQFEPNWVCPTDEDADRTSPYHRGRVRALRALSAEWDVSPSTVLDYGGEEDAWLTKRAFPLAEVRGYDISSPFDPPPPHSHDLIVCAHVLEHVSYPVPFLSSLRHFLKPGGYVYLEVPYDDFDLKRTLIPGHPLNSMHEHVSQFSPTALCRVARKCGLKPVKIRNFPTPYYKGTAMLAVLDESSLGEGEQDPPLEEPESMDEPISPGPDILRVHLWAKEAIRNGTRFVIHPAGAYTLDLLAQTALAKAGAVALTDNDTRKHGQSLMGHPVLGPSSIPDLGVELVLVASPSFEDPITRDLAWLGAKGIRVVKVSELPGPAE